MNILALGAMINSALYLAGCFTAGLYAGNGLAWRLALASAGLAFVAYNWMFVEKESGRANTPLQACILSILSIATGAAAGLALLIING